MGRRVAERARIVAEDLGEPLDLVHVLEPVSEAMIGPGLARLMRRHEKERVEELGAWCRERSEIDITVELVKGVPSWELGKRGKGGGHGMMAGGWIPLDKADENVGEALQNSLSTRLARYLKKNPERLAPLIEDS